MGQYGYQKILNPLGQNAPNKILAGKQFSEKKVVKEYCHNFF
jgi:hypothetical protein